MSDTSFVRFVQDLCRDPNVAASLNAARARLRDDDDGSASSVASTGPQSPNPPTTQEPQMTANTHTGDLDLARIMLANDDFIEGRIGTDAEEHSGEEEPSLPGTVSLDLNGEVAETLLAARGWKRGGKGGWGAWYAPDGDSKHWDTGEALRLALTAEAV